ncbi:hypothetical protein PSPO01_15720 [Paraphaeosphaeria sporulosa]
MPGSELRLLAVDGGGVRGLSALMILEQLMEAVQLRGAAEAVRFLDVVSKGILMQHRGTTSRTASDDAVVGN